MIQQKATLTDLVGFYKNLVEALDLKVDKQGKIIITTGEKERPLTINGLPVVLPTDENTRTAVEIINGIPTPVKIIFNPMDEDAIKGENESLKKLRQIIELKLNGVFYQIGETIFNVLFNTDKEVNHIEIIRFATLLNRHKAPGLKNPIDEKLITNWIKLYREILASNYDTHAYIKIFSKRGGKINNVKYNRINSLGFPFAEEIYELKPNKEKFLGLKLRTKDKHAYLSLFEYIFKVDTNKLLEGFKFGSLNKIAPGFHALMITYDFVFKHMFNIINALVELDVEDRELEYLNLSPLPVDINNMGDFIDNLESVIKRIPKEDNLKQPAQVNNVPNNTIQQSSTPTHNSNSPWDSLKQRAHINNIGMPAGYNNGYNNGYGAPVAKGPLGSFGGSRTTVPNMNTGGYNNYGNYPAPTAPAFGRPNPVFNNGPVSTAPFGRPMATRGFGPQRAPEGNYREAYQNPFTRGR